MPDALAGQVSSTPLSRAAARAFDADAQQRLRVAGELLMENAGAAVAREAEAMARARGAARCVVLCGTGNNGGDGLVAARHLAGALPVRVLLAGARSAVRGDAAANLARLDAMGLAVEEARGAAALRDALRGGGAVLVDALFGIGLDRPLDGLARELVEAANASGAPILAVDVPSGLDSDRGVALGAAMRAAVTVTFVAPKLGFALADGPAHVGRVVVAGIGVPAPR